YLDRKVRNIYDATTLDMASLGGVFGPPPPALPDAFSRSVANNSSKQFTQEVRIQNNEPDAALNWVAGIFYQRVKMRDVFNVSGQDLLRMVNYGRANSVPAQPPCTTVAQCFFGVPLYQDQYSIFLDTHSVDKQIAAFAQFDYKITPRLKLTAGARYAKLDYTATVFRAGPVIVSPGASDTINQRSKPFTPKLGLSWQADANNLFYGNVAKGFRLGGVAVPVGNRCAADGTALGFDPNTPRALNSDSVWSYEIGSKNRLFGGKVNLDVAAYKIDWKNIQTILTLPSCQIPTTLNLGDAVSKGVDLSITANPYPGLSLGVAAAYNESHYTTTSESSIPGQPIRRAGEPLGNPPWSLNFNGEYEFEVGRARPYVRGDLAYTSHDDTPLDLSSPIVNPDIPRTPAITTLNLRLGVRARGADISLFALNALNAHPEIARYEDTPPANYFRGVTLRPRTIGLTVTFRN
ncbi:MAG TPA: TonB-dependent receptor, partial [Sphingobium sp.]